MKQYYIYDYTNQMSSQQQLINFKYELIRTVITTVLYIQIPKIILTRTRHYIHKK